MAHTIVTEVCEGATDCVDACPVACIHPGPSRNVKGNEWHRSEFTAGTDCGMWIHVSRGVSDCVRGCPVPCIHPGPSRKIKGNDWYWIDFTTCIDCGICIQVCPV